MKQIENKQIAVVGGGPGGLTLARLLQMKGAHVKVYERDVNRQVRVQGATLDLHDDAGLKALAAAGLMDAFKANYRPGADKLRIVDKHASILLEEAVNDEENLTRPEIDRGPLRDILLNSLQENTVVWDSHFSTMSPTGDAWKLEFKNGTSVIADIVIAADGANSKIRPFITPIKPFFAGMTALEGAVYNAAEVIPQVDALVDGGKVFALGDGKTFILSSKGDGSLPFYIGFTSGEDWYRSSGIDFSDKEQVAGWFKQTFAGWDPLWLQLFTHAGTPFIPRPQYCIPLDQTWKALPNLTMLGDAAHLMPPYAGEGVNMAMLDALELADCLTSDAFTDTHSAIAHYEHHMRIRAAASAKETLKQTEKLHSPEGLQYMLNFFGER